MPPERGRVMVQVMKPKAIMAMHTPASRQDQTRSPPG
jgi:hypothetical protein